MRSMGHPDYEHQPWSDERKAKASAFHRKRWAAPEGYATVRGVHVPFEHRAPIRYWSDHIFNHDGEEAARAFVQSLSDNEWRDMPRVTALYRAKKDIAAMREQIRQFEWEARRGNSDDA